MNPSYRRLNAPQVMCGLLTALVLIGSSLVGVAPTRAADPAPRPPMDAAEIDVALKRLTVTGTALYLAAHPDDENTAVLTWLENVAGVRAAYLSMTRGDGGQNLIGNEKGDLLGLVRTQELLAARRIDGAEQFFTRALDFGFSKNPDETLAFWGRDSVLADVVRTIRYLKPDIVINRFPTTGEGGHGHHTASAILSVEAYTAAADPNRFPEQVGRYGTWQPKRVFHNWFSFGPQPDSAMIKKMVQVDVGDYAPLLGKSSNELAADSRSMHKSQGFGSAERRGHQVNYFRVVAGDTVATGLFDGIDLSWKRIKGAEALGPMFEAIRRDYDPRDPSKSLPALLEAHRKLTEYRKTSAAAPWADRLDRKSDDLLEVIRSCAGLWLEAVASEPALAAGDSLKVNLLAVNRSPVPMTVTRAVLLVGPRSGPLVTAAVDKILTDNTPVTAVLNGVLPSDAEWTWTQPWWLREPHGKGALAVPDSKLFDAIDTPPLATALVDIEVGGQTLTWRVPVANRSVDRVRGEIYRPLAVVPDVTVRLDEKVYLFPNATAKPVTVTLTAKKAGPATVSLAAPAGWTVTPKEASVDLKAGNVPATTTFQLVPPSGSSTASPVITARATRGGKSFDRDLVVIDYNHLPVQMVCLPAEAHAVRLDLAHKGARIGYVMGPGDEIPPVLAQAGYEVVLLTDTDLESARLSTYDAVVIGIRAYNSRDALKRRNDQLLQYAEAGGTVVVQYNTSDNTLYKGFPPFPLTLGRDRVTVEEAPVTLLEPSSPLLSAPNRITDADFTGWVQERGLYFASEWDPKFTPLLASNDPGEPERKGGLLVARTGKGVFIYTGYAFFRQLPAGVPGAIRLFVNLVSAE